MASDPLEPAGIHFGTNSGSFYLSADEGDGERASLDTALAEGARIYVLTAMSGG